MIALNIAETRRALRLMRGAYPKRYGVQPCLSLVNHGGASALRAVDPCGIEITMALPLSQIVSGRDEIHDIPFFALGAMLRPKADSPDVEIAAPEAGRVSMGVDGMLASFIVRKTEDVASLFEYSRKLREPGEPCPSLTIGAKPLAKALALCARSMSVEETRYYLNGVYLSPHPTDDTAVVFVSNDGHRMIKHALAGVKHDLAEGMIIPRETVAALQTLLAAFPEDTLDLVRVGPTQLLARGPNLMLRTPLIDGTFPDYERVIPKEQPLRFTLDADILDRFVKRVAAIGRPRGGVAISGMAGLDVVNVRCLLEDGGYIQAEIPGQSEDTFEIGFQARYLIDAMATLRAQQIQFFADSQSAPTIISGAAELADPSTTIVIMPMRI